jgi:hypothetical protein
MTVPVRPAYAPVALWMVVPVARDPLMMNPGRCASGAMLTCAWLTMVPTGNMPWVKRKVVMASNTAQGGGTVCEQARSSVALPTREPSTIE